MDASKEFSYIDYIVFGLLLCASSCIGLYYRFTGARQSTTNEVFLGGRTMSLIPVTFSIVASFVSGVSILGTASEVYQFGCQYAVLVLSYLVGFPLAAEIFMPIFYRMSITSGHEYLEKRFSQPVRYVTSAVFILQMIFYISVVLYAPSLAFSQVSGLPMWLSLISTGLVCTFYTSLGGMKAVIWTDFLQSLIMLAGLIAVVILGTISVGGPQKVIDTAKEGQRWNLFNFDPNPLQRHTFWTLVIGGSGMVTTIYATNQTQIQRYLSCRTLNTARVSLWLSIPITMLFTLLMVGSGLVAYAYYIDCDPKLVGTITKMDQLIPQLVLDLFSTYPGIPGLYMSSIFAAALSTVSSGINSLAAVLMIDVIQPIYNWRMNRFIKDSRAAFWSKLIAVMLGLVVIGLAFTLSSAAPTILQIALSIFGMMGGPILSVFTMGILFPCINWKGALSGLVSCLGVSLWLGIGAIFYGQAPVVLPLSATNCSNVTIIPNPLQPRNLSIYDLSYLYYTAVSLFVAFIVSLIVSALSGFNTNSPIPSNLIADPVVQLCKYSPYSLPTQLRSLQEEEFDVSVGLRKHPVSTTTYDTIL